MRRKTAQKIRQIKPFNDEIKRYFKYNIFYLKKIVFMVRDVFFVLLWISKEVMMKLDEK